MGVHLNVYIIHDTRLEERQANIAELRKLAKEEQSLSVDITVIDQHPPDSINIANIKNLVKLEALPTGENPFYNSFLRKMSIEALSNTFNHFKALQTIGKLKDKSEENDEYFLVLEDDVVYSAKIFKQLKSLIDNASVLEWDFLFLGQPKDNNNDVADKSLSENRLHFHMLDNTNLLLHCCESYMIKASSARDFVTHMFPIRYYFNVQMSYLLDKHKNRFKCAKIFPNICGDGSKIGAFNSSVLPNNVLIFNDLYKEVYMLLERHTSILAEETVSNIKQRLDTNPYKDNPDFIYLEALLYRKQGNLEKSRDLFEKAMVSYEAKHVPINNTSTFLRNYIELHRFLQNVR